MKKTELSTHLQQYFADQSVITTLELTEVLNHAFPDLSPNTISWKISQLKKDKLIHQRGRGLYSFEFKPEYVPELSLKTKRIYNRIKSLGEFEISVWDTVMISSITDFEINKYWIFIYAPLEELEALFDKMLDFSKQVFLQPDKEIITRYMIHQTDAIILLPLKSEAPQYLAGDYISPSIEGILVNAWLAYNNYLEPIGFDIKQIFIKAFLKYNVNQSKLLRYAARRDKRKEVESLLKMFIL